MTEGNNVRIIEITRKATQGRSEPYLCVGEDNLNYYVKGRQSGRSTLIYEWICAHLAKSFGLPIPKFFLAEIPEELLLVTDPELRNIGSCTAFASQEVPFSSWLEEASIGKVDIELQRKILTFDWWIQNCDRSIHNQNLLWDNASRRAVVIDHNMAFDAEFSPEVFKKYHIFGAAWSELVSDMFYRLSAQEQLENALAVFDTAIGTMPPEWLWIDPELTIPTNIDINKLRLLLLRCKAGDFWGL